MLWTAGAINIALLAAKQIKSSFDKLPTFVISPSASLPNSSWSHWILVQICWLHNICSTKGSKQSNCLAAQNQQNLSLSGFETNPQTYLTKILSPRPCSIFWSQYSPLAHPCPKGSYNGLKHRGWSLKRQKNGYDKEYNGGLAPKPPSRCLKPEKNKFFGQNIWVKIPDESALKSTLHGCNMYSGQPRPGVDEQSAS